MRRRFAILSCATLAILLCLVAVSQAALSTQAERTLESLLCPSGKLCQLLVQGRATPALSVTGQGVIYFDSTTNTFQASQNGGAFVTLVGAGGSAPANATYIVQTAHAGLSAEQSLGALTTGLTLNTVTGSTGVLSTYAGSACGAGTKATSISASGVVTCSAVSLTADVSGILPGLNGGTGNGFTAFSGPTTALKTFTLPNADSTILTDNADVTLAQGGTNASLVASNGGLVYSDAAAFAILAGTATAGQIPRSGSNAAPSWSTATYPATIGVSELLYGSSANVIGGLATGNNGVLVTSGAGVPSISSTLPTATQDNITRLGTIANIGASLGVAFGGTGAATYSAGLVISPGTTTALTTVANVAAGQVLVSGTPAAWSATPSVTSLATSAAIPLLLTNGQLVNIALTSQTVGATTLTIPDFASVVDEFTFKTKAQVMSNKTFVAPALGTPASGVMTNVTGLPAAAVLAGTFGTGAYVMDTSLTNPLLIGGTGTTSALTLRSTSGVGAAGADIVFQVGNNGATEAGRILNSGNWGIGIAAPVNRFAVQMPSAVLYNTAGVWLQGANTTDGISIGSLDTSYKTIDTYGGNLHFQSTSGNAVIFGLAGTTLGTIGIAGNTSGLVTLSVAAAAGTWTMKLPTAVGTAGFQLTDAAGDGVTSWAAAGSRREWKDITGRVEPQEALASVLATPVYKFRYKPGGVGTGDYETEYVGVMADEAPWAMHHNNSIVSPINTLGYSVLSIQALHGQVQLSAERIAALERRINELQAMVSGLERH